MKDQRLISINSKILSVYFSVNAIAWAFGITGGYPLIILSVFFIFEIFNYKQNRKRRRIFFIISFVLMFFLLSLIRHKGTLVNQAEYKYYFLNFLLIGVPSLILSKARFDFFELLKYIIYISIFIYPVLFYRIYRNESLFFDSGKMMGLSYAVLCFIIASIIIQTFKYVDWKIKTLSLISFFCYSSFLVGFGSRGTVLSLLASIILLWLIFRKNLYLWLIYILVSLSFIAIYFMEIVNKIYVFLLKYDINAYFLYKITQVSHPSFSN